MAMLRPPTLALPDKKEGDDEAEKKGGDDEAEKKDGDDEAEKEPEKKFRTELRNRTITHTVPLKLTRFDMTTQHTTHRR